MRETIQEALSENIGRQGNVGVASPPNKYPPFASAGEPILNLDFQRISGVYSFHTQHLTAMLTQYLSGQCIASMHAVMTREIHSLVVRFQLEL